MQQNPSFIHKSADISFACVYFSSSISLSNEPGQFLPHALGYSVLARVSHSVTGIWAPRAGIPSFAVRWDQEVRCLHHVLVLIQRWLQAIQRWLRAVATDGIDGLWQTPLYLLSISGIYNVL